MLVPSVPQRSCMVAKLDTNCQTPGQLNDWAIKTRQRFHCAFCGLFLYIVFISQLHNIHACTCLFISEIISTDSIHWSKSYSCKTTARLSAVHHSQTDSVLYELCPRNWVKSPTHLHSQESCAVNKRSQKIANITTFPRQCRHLSCHLL